MAKSWGKFLPVNQELITAALLPSRAGPG